MPLTDIKLDMSGGTPQPGFVSDAAYVSLIGSPSSEYFPSGTAVDLTGVATEVTAENYQTARFCNGGILRYTFPSLNAQNHRLRLHFFCYGANGFKFHIDVNGVRKFTDYQAGGDVLGKVSIVDLDITPDGGEIIVDLTTSVTQAVISALTLKEIAAAAAGIVRLKWDAPTGHAPDHYVLAQSKTGDFTDQILTTIAGNLTQFDKSVEAVGAYFYKLKSVDAGGTEYAFTAVKSVNFNAGNLASMILTNHAADVSSFDETTATGDDLLATLGTVMKLLGANNTASAGLSSMILTNHAADVLVFNEQTATLEGIARALATIIKLVKQNNAAPNGLASMTLEGHSADVLAFNQTGANIEDLPKIIGTIMKLLGANLV